MLLRKQHLMAENSPSPPDYTAHSNGLMYACCSRHGPATKFKTHKRLKEQNETQIFFHCMKQNNTETFAFILVTASSCGTRVVKVTKLDVWSFSSMEVECGVEEGIEDI